MFAVVKVILRGVNIEITGVCVHMAFYDGVLITDSIFEFAL